MQSKTVNSEFRSSQPTKIFWIWLFASCMLKLGSKASCKNYHISFITHSIVLHRFSVVFSMLYASVDTTVLFPLQNQRGCLKSLTPLLTFKVSSLDIFSVMLSHVVRVNYLFYSSTFLLLVVLKQRLH